VYEISEIRKQWLSRSRGSMNGHYGKMEIATCGLRGKCRNEKLFNISNKNTGVLISP
jgi:hypothetical protein